VQIIKFFISNQRAWRYTSGVVTEGANLKFEFIFKTEDWNAASTKTAVFSYKGKNYMVELDAYNQCTVPKEAIHDPCFKVSLYGGEIHTNTVKIPVEPVEGIGNDTSSVVYVPSIDNDKILTWTATKVTNDLVEIPPTDLNPFDEWTEDGDINSEYEWEEE
jgi:hypothetical protein